MERGFIKIWRKTVDSGLLQMHGTLAMLVHLLMNATHKPVKRGTKYGIVSLERGQGVLAIRTLAKDLKLSVQSTRTSLERLKNMEILTLQSTHHYSIYTVVNYDKYQSVSEEVTHSATHLQHTSNTPPTQEQELKHLSIKEINTLVPLSAPKANGIPYHKIVELYHQALPMLPKVQKLTKKREGQIGARWRSGDLPDLETWKEYFEFCAKSPFLTGKSDPVPGHAKWRADLEWLTNEGNFVKVWEKKYHG
jgi:DNA-binding transcriptional regulator YhcF (GntR family)